MLANQPIRQHLLGLTMICHFLLMAAAAASLSDGAVAAQAGSALDSPALRVISDQDAADMNLIKYHISNDYSEFKNVDEVNNFLDKVKLLVQKHPKNVAFAQDELKELHKFLSQESVTKLIRVDTDLFVAPISDDKLALAQRALDQDELARKLFGGPMRSLVEARRQQSLRPEDGPHKDGNIFASFWCKISGSCTHQ